MLMKSVLESTRHVAITAVVSIVLRALRSKLVIASAALLVAIFRQGDLSCSKIKVVALENRSLFVIGW